MTEFLFPEFDDELRLEKLRERWRFEAMVPLPVFTKLFYSFTPLGRIYVVYQICKHCGFTILRNFGVHHETD